MKKALIILAFTCFLWSCESEQDKQKRIAEEKIYSALTLQAKCILNYPDTYEFEKMNDYRVNDSIRVYAQKFSGSNAFGVKENRYAIGYFNINTGLEISSDMLYTVASTDELRTVKSIVNAR